MKESIPYHVLPIYTLRTPLLPLNFIQGLLTNRDIQKQLNEIVKRPEINEALFVAAPEFHEQIKKLFNNQNLEAKDRERIIQTLYKYLSRMATRPTPFGLFSGVSTGTIENKTEIQISNITKHNRHTRLDMLFLCNLAAALSKNVQIKNSLRYFPNSTLYKSGENIRYIEYRYKKNSRTHHIVQVKNSIYLDLVIQKAKNGSLITSLIKELEDEAIPHKHAIEYVHKLIDNQILISELDPTVTGNEFLHKILNILSSRDGIGDLKNILNQVNNKIDNIDQKIGNNPDIYYEIVNDLKMLNLDFDFDLKYLFQIDLSVNSEKSCINENIVQSLFKGIEALNKLTIKNKKNNLQQFKEAFLRRYETKKLPLLKVLDTETGIGYLQNNHNSIGDISPLIADIVLPYIQDENIVSLNSIQKILLDKYAEAIAENSYEVEITDKDLKTFEANWHDLPPTFSAMIKIVEASNDQFPEGRILMENIGGNSATCLLGRFCHVNKKVHKLTQEIAEHEKTLFPNAILAEIVHLPESRVGNVILRPILRDYEIPVLTNPATDNDNVITLEDLLISVENDEIVLYSKRLKKRIIPRLSNAHNYSFNAIPIYQFLCDLQGQNLRSSIGFNWGNVLNHRAFKPRVIYKNFIFSPASWLITKDELNEFYKFNDEQELVIKINKWAEKLKMPNLVLLEEGDNELFVDLRNPLAIKTLLSIVKNRTKFVLKEFLFNPNNTIVKSEVGTYTNEFIFSFCKNEMKQNE